MPEGFTADGRLIRTNEVGRDEAWHVGGKNNLIIYDAGGWPVANAEVYHGHRDLEGSKAVAALIAMAPAMRRELEQRGVFRQADDAAEIERLKAENGQLRANLEEYRVECEKLRRRGPERGED